MDRFYSGGGTGGQGVAQGGVGVRRVCAWVCRLRGRERWLRGIGGGFDLGGRWGLGEGESWGEVASREWLG